jgi:hypothetical protein
MFCPLEEFIPVLLKIHKYLRPTLSTGLALAFLGVITGCSPEGTGTIKVDPGARAKIEGSAGTKPAKSEKQAKGREAAEEAVKKHPKLQ